MILDLHNHKVYHGDAVLAHSVPLKEVRQRLRNNPQTSLKENISEHTSVFLGIQNLTQEATAKDVDDIVTNMCSEVALLLSQNIWQNHKLTSEQKEAAVSRIVAELVDEYLEESRPPTNSLMPLSPLLNEPDFSPTQLPALAAPLRISGPLPPFNSLQNQLPSLQSMLEAAKTLNPVQLMKTHDLSEFKVDNIGGAPLLLLLFLAPGAPSPGDREGLLGNLNLGYWSSVGLNE